MIERGLRLIGDRQAWATAAKSLVPFLRSDELTHEDRAELFLEVIQPYSPKKPRTWRFYSTVLIALSDHMTEIAKQIAVTTDPIRRSELNNEHKQIAERMIAASKHPLRR